MLTTGDMVPTFSLPRDGGGMLSDEELRGKAVVLYFYPKDDTPGCTKQAIAFTEHAAAFDAAGATIVGVSKDPVSKHDKFVAKHSLGIALISDAESDLCERTGVWVEKSMYGKTYMGIERTTLLIDKTGVIQSIWRKVKVPGHVETVLDAVKTL